MSIATFVHISDLHIGDIEFTTGERDRTLDAEAKHWWRYCPGADGFLGHSEKAMRALADFMGRVHAEKPGLLVTGDLTAYGSDHQFLIARTYLTGHLPGWLGLNRPDALDFAIPGNHDHWPGRFGWPGVAWMWGAESKAFGIMFPTPTASFTITPLKNGPRLLIAQIDSDADVGTTGFKRTLAQGSFVSELDALDYELPEPQDGEVRVLLVHHSLHHRDGDMRLLEIVPRDRQVLEDFLVHHEFDVILTGHCHTPCLVTHVLTSQVGDERDVHEFRCGTTLQDDEFHQAQQSDTEHGKEKRPVRNSLLVHRIEQAGRGYQWEAETWVRVGNSFELEGDAEAFPLKL